MTNAGDADNLVWAFSGFGAANAGHIRFVLKIR